MYVDKCTTRGIGGKTFTRYLLRESKRQGKQTIKTTILNITPWGEQTCEAIRFALKYQHRLSEIGIEPTDYRSMINDLQVMQEKPVGTVWLLHQMAMRNGLLGALGDSPQGRLALWQVMARVIDQGSRLSAVRLAREYETDFLRLGPFTENDLYKNLDWIAANQQCIENALYKKRHGHKPCKLFLYDVTSSYFEGIRNELAKFGYHRDKKRGKMQIVVGLLCDEDGIPVSVEVFEGVSVENQSTTSRINHLRSTKAAVKFLSMEPLIGPVDDLNLAGIDWVIVGGESGPKARPMDEDWVVSIKNSCEEQEVPFFFKQWGGVNKKRAGRVLLGKTWDAMPTERYASLATG